MGIKYLCESGTNCSHVIPDEIYYEFSDWIDDRGGDFYIVHQDCLQELVVLKHEDVWCVAAEDPE